MPKSVKPITMEEATAFVRRCETVIGNSTPIKVLAVRIDGVPCAFFGPRKNLCIVQSRLHENFQERCLDAMASFWCHHEYERRKHNATLALVPNSTAKPVLYEYGGPQWKLYRSKLRSNLFTS